MDLARGRCYQSKLVLYYFTEANSEACQRVNNISLQNKYIIDLLKDEFITVKII